jgi:hypothetical protein
MTDELKQGHRGIVPDRPGVRTSGALGRGSSSRDAICPSCPSTPGAGRADTARVRLVAAALAAPFDRDLTVGLARVERALIDARERGVGLLVLPESALGGYLREPGPERARSTSPPGSSPTARRSPA